MKIYYQSLPGGDLYAYKAAGLICHSSQDQKYGADRLGTELFALHDFWTLGIFGKRV